MKLKKIVILVLALVVIYIAGPFVYTAVTRSERRVETVRLGKPFGAGTAEIKIATFNIGRGRDGALRHNTQALSSPELIRKQLREIGKGLLLEGVDVVVLNEVDFNCTRTFGIEMAREIAEAGGYAVIVRQPIVDTAWGHKRYLWGNAVLSKIPVMDAKMIEFPERHPLVTLFAGRMNGLLVGLKARAGREFRVLGVHLEVSGGRYRQPAARRILELARRESPLIVLGDFNSRRALGGNKADRDDAAYTLFGSKLLKGTESRAFTFPAWAPDRVIDWVMVTDEFEFTGYEVFPWRLSDHLPVVAGLRFVE